MTALFTKPSRFLPLAALLALLPARTQDIAWQPDYEATLAQAASGNRVVFVAINMDGERANDRMAKEVYHDPAIEELAARTLPLVASVTEHSTGDMCPRFGAIPCSAHRTVDTLVRTRLLKPDARGYVVAPQHVFLGSKGEVLLSVPYELTVHELEWCFATALTLADPANPVQPSSKARAPKRLVMGGVFELGTGGGAMLSREQVIELIKELKKGTMGGEEVESALRDLVTADEPEAMDFVSTLLRGGGGGGRGGGAEAERVQGGRSARILRWIGVWSPRSWWELPAEYAVGGREDLRREAIVALEQIGAPESLKRIQEGLRKEKEPRIAKDYLRALGSVGATAPGTLDTLLKYVRREKDGLLRANAIVAIGYLPGDDEVRAALTELLDVPEAERAEKSRERIAAACAMGLSRDSSWRPLLESVRAEAEQSGDEQLGGAADAALSVLRVGDLATLRKHVMEVCEDDIPRERLFGIAGA